MNQSAVSGGRRAVNPEGILASIPGLARLRDNPGYLNQ